MATPFRSRLRAASVVALLVLAGVGCTGRRSVDASLAPLSTEPLRPGDRITHVNGEPVNEKAGVALGGVPAGDGVVYTVRRKDGRVERLGPARLNRLPATAGPGR